MWTSAAGPVRRLGLIASHQACKTFSSTCAWFSYSVLTAVRSECLRGCRSPQSLSTFRLLSSSGLYQDQQSLDDEPTSVAKLMVNSLKSEATEASEVSGAPMPGTRLQDENHSSRLLYQQDTGGKLQGDSSHANENQPQGYHGHLNDNQLQLESDHSSDSQLQLDSDHSSDGQLQSEPRRQTGQLPVQSYGLAPYVASSPGLRKLVELGVDVSSWDRRPGIAPMVLKLDWHQHMAPCVQWLHDAGVPADRLGKFITRNPLIFKESLEDLQTRVDYLRAKRFTEEQVVSVISRDPFWLMFSTARIDRRLGLWAGMFDLRAAEVRRLAAAWPRLITSNIQHVKDSTFTLKEEFGFERDELKQILLNKPKVWMLARSALQDRLQFLHNEMGLSHQLIAESPAVLTCRVSRVRPRHLLLSTLGRDQYDRRRPGYVALDSLVGATDRQFCDIAQVPVATYNEFLKTL